MDGCMDEEDTQYAFVTRRSNSTHQLVMPIISYCMPPSVVKQSSKKSIAHSIHFPFSLSLSLSLSLARALVRLC